MILFEYIYLLNICIREEEKEGGEYNAEAILKIAVKSSAKAIKEKVFNSVGP